MSKETFTTGHIKTLIFGELDKAFEIGFEDDMREIFEALLGGGGMYITPSTASVILERWKVAS